MGFLTTRLNARVRAYLASDWEDCVLLRWSAQILVGALPGLLILIAVMRMASHGHPSGAHAGQVASLIPLLSASAIADTPAFHRLDVAKSQDLGAEVQFRLPRAEAPAMLSKVRATPAPSSSEQVDFDAPRTHWQHLTSSVRSDIDEGLTRAPQWERVVLHGTGNATGSTRRLKRYLNDVRGVPEGLAWHFVIGNGEGSADGLIEATDGWKRALPAASGGDPGLRYTSISVCLAGDFHERPPTKAQLEALDELLDYISVKLGNIPVATHADARGERAGCLGEMFPANLMCKDSS